MTTALSQPLMHQSYQARLHGGEVLPLVVDDRGIPPRLPYLYALTLRKKRLASSTMHEKLKRIALLHAVYEQVFDAPLDRLFLYGGFPSRRDLLLCFERVTEVGAKQRAFQIANTWAVYLAWIADQGNWWPITVPHPERDAVDSRTREAEYARTLMFDHAGAISRPRRQRWKVELSDEHILTIARAIGPDRDGSFSASPFGQGTALRNWLIFSLLRHLGIRRGELLALKTTALKRLTEHELREREVRLRAGRPVPPQMLQLERIPDDAENPRLDVSVKRGSRRIPVSDALAKLWWQYCDGDGPGGRPQCTSPFLIVTAQGQPLSVQGLRDVFETIRARSTAVYASMHNEDSPELAKLTRHCLRHYRAVEALGDFFPNGVVDPTEKGKYLEYFGWAAPESALPYLRRIDERAAQRLASKPLDVPSE